MDKFISAYKAMLQPYANFEGRTSVGGYWRAFLVNLVIAIVLYALTLAASALIIAYIVYALAVLVPGLAIAVRRLHDTGKSGWFVLISLVPIIGGIILIVFLATKGNPGPNQYGNPVA